MVKPILEGKDRILEFLGCSESDIEANFTESESIISYVDRQIGSHDYWQVSYPELAWLYSLVHIMHAGRVAETGVGPGSTSFAILRAMEEWGGELYSFDKGIKYGEEDFMPVGFLVPEEYRGRWNLVIGDSKETLENNLKRHGPFDVFFHDSEHTFEHVTFELENAIKYMKSNFAMAIDNYDWTDAPEKFAERHHLLLVPVVDDMCFILPQSGKDSTKK